MMTEAVGYVSGRSDVLAATFFLSAFLLMRTGLVTGRVRWVALSLLPLALALASKEVSVMFPFVVLAYDRLILRRSGAEFRRDLRRVHLPLIGTVLFLGAARVMVFVLVENASARDAPARALAYLTVQFGAVWKYVGLLVLPLHQSIAHSGSGRMAQVLGAIALGATCLRFVSRKAEVSVQRVAPIKHAAVFAEATDPSCGVAVARRTSATWHQRRPRIGVCPMAEQGAKTLFVRWQQMKHAPLGIVRREVSKR